MFRFPPPLTLLALILLPTPLLATPPAPLQGELKITLAEAVTLALERNPDYLGAQARGRGAEARVGQGRSALGLKLNLQASHRHNLSVEPLQKENGQRYALVLGKRIFSPAESAGVRALDRLAEADRHAIIQDRANLANQVARAFFDLLLADQLIFVNRETLAQVERQRDQSAEKFRAGTLPRVDLLRSEVELGNIRPKVIEAEYIRTIALQKMVNLLALDGGDALLPIGEFLSPAPIPPLGEIIAAAEGGRGDIISARSRIAAQRALIDKSRHASSPILSLDITADHQSDLANREATRALASLQWPLVDAGFKRHATTEALANEDKAGRELASLVNGVRLELTVAYSQSEKARAVLHSTALAIRQAEEVLGIAEAGYAVGSKTYLEVLDAQLALAVARTLRATAQRDFSVAIADLYKGQGLVFPEPTKKENF